MQLDGLNQRQREAVTYGEGPLLILAGAGSGKTRTLTHRLAYLVESGMARPYEILAITFTNKAAQEMRGRVDRLLGDTSGVWVHTFHAAALRILRQEAGRIGYPASFTIYDTGDQERLMKRILTRRNTSDRDFPPHAVLSRISRAKSELIGPGTFERESSGSIRDRTMAALYGDYQEELKAAGAMDFDDLLRLCVDLWRDHPDVLAHYQERFRFVLVDEYQDTNTAQYEWVRLLTAQNRNLSAVGDPDQSIYGWRGANFRNILRFQEDFPGTCTVVLTENYRSTARILQAANAVVRHNQERAHKDLVAVRGDGASLSYAEGDSELDEARLVVQEIDRLIRDGVSPAEIAVLYRVNAQSRPLEEALLRLTIPYRLIGAARFYDRAEIKDALSYLRLAVNPSDGIALERAAQSPRRGFGEASVEKIAAYARAEGQPVGSVLGFADEVPGLPAKARDAARQLGSLLADVRLREAEGEPIATLLEWFLDASGLRQALLRTGENGSREDRSQAEGRLENLASLVAKAREAQDLADGALSLADFLAQVSLTQNQEDAADRPSVVLMTVHTAKGLEFPIVFVTGLEEGLFPHRRAFESQDDMEEERRLLYVAMTRAQDRLYLTRARTRSLHSTRGMPVTAEASRFLREVPAELVTAFGPAFAGVGSSRGYVGLSAPGPKRRLARSDGGFAVGDPVVHPKFGPGVVTAVHPQGDDIEVSVLFPNHGERHLLLAYAGLERTGA